MYSNYYPQMSPPSKLFTTTDYSSAEHVSPLIFHITKETGIKTKKQQEKAVGIFILSIHSSHNKPILPTTTKEIQKNNIILPFYCNRASYPVNLVLWSRRLCPTSWWYMGDQVLSECMQCCLLLFPQAIDFVVRKKSAMEFNSWTLFHIMVHLCGIIL